ncbi:MAG TPA: outer membrane beta-barrel protein [Burkholderiales bacterium]|nr:outer membrane beta-barrel protein [Burkholderiales bacterium]
MNKIKFALLIVGFATSTAALADNTGFFLGATLGKAEAAKADACLDPNIQCDRKDQSWTGNAGYMFTPNWGGEVAYHYLGRVVDQNDGAGLQSYAKSRAGSVSLVAAFPIEKFSLYGKFGGYRAKTDVTSSYLTEGSSKNNGWVYGFGIRWDVFSHLALRAEMLRFNSIGGGAVGFRTDVNTMTGGVLLTF